MATNLIAQITKTNGTSAGITYTWINDYQCRVQGTSTGIGWNSLLMTSLTNTPFLQGHTYSINYGYTSGNVYLRGYWYTNTDWATLTQLFQSPTDTNFTILNTSNAMILRVWVPAGVTVNEIVTCEIYDITYTDVDADCDMMMSVLGYPNSWFYPKWIQFASGALWDGESCSEIACCISYMAGNLSKIYVSNYAQGLADLFRANGRFGSTPSRGAFIWFDYDGDGVPDHTGRVYEILADGTIHTVEGNVGGLVVERYYPANTSYIYGYGYPNYDNDPAQDPGTPTPPKFVYLPFWSHKRRERGN